MAKPLLQAILIVCPSPGCGRQLFPEVELGKEEDRVIKCECGTRYLLSTRPVIAWELRDFSVGAEPTRAGTYDPDFTHKDT